MAVFLNIVTYIGCDDDTKAQIARIEAIIELLQDAELNGATNADIEEYRLDDGQTVIKTIFRDMTIIEKTINALYRRRTRLLNLCAGHRYGLIDGKVKI